MNKLNRKKIKYFLFWGTLIIFLFAVGLSAIAIFLRAFIWDSETLEIVAVFSIMASAASYLIYQFCCLFLSEAHMRLHHLMWLIITTPFVLTMMIISASVVSHTAIHQFDEPYEHYDKFERGRQ